MDDKPAIFGAGSSAPQSSFVTSSNTDKSSSQNWQQRAHSMKSTPRDSPKNDVEMEDSAETEKESKLKYVPKHELPEIPWKFHKQKDVAAYLSFPELYEERKLCTKVPENVPNHLNFDKFPSDIRQMIYKLIIPTYTCIELWADRHNSALRLPDKVKKLGEYKNDITPDLKLLRVSKKIGQEAAELFYSSNEFSFSCFSGWTVLAAFMMTIGEANACSLKRVACHVPLAGGYHTSLSQLDLPRVIYPMSVFQASLQGLPPPIPKTIGGPGPNLVKKFFWQPDDCFTNVISIFEEYGNLTSLKLLMPTTFRTKVSDRWYDAATRSHKKDHAWVMERLQKLKSSIPYLDISLVVKKISHHSSTDFGDQHILKIALQNDELLERVLVGFKEYESKPWKKVKKGNPIPPELIQKMGKLSKKKGAYFATVKQKALEKNALEKKDPVKLAEKAARRAKHEKDVAAAKVRKAKEARAAEIKAAEIKRRDQLVAAAIQLRKDIDAKKAANDKAAKEIEAAEAKTPEEVEAAAVQRQKELEVRKAYKAKYREEARIEREKQEIKMACRAEEENRRTVAKANGLVYVNKKSFLRDMARVEREAKAAAQAPDIQAEENVSLEVQDAEMSDVSEKELDEENSDAEKATEEISDSEMHVAEVPDAAGKKPTNSTKAEDHRVTAGQYDVHRRTGVLLYGRNQY